MLKYLIVWILELYFYHFYLVNLILFLDLLDQDSEIRTFYVGATRAKKQLHIVEENRDNGFRI